jgi:uncharacterized membrane protein required for colicin V production
MIEQENMDLFVLFIFLLMIGVGLYRGFAREVLGFFSLICAISLSVISNKWIMVNILSSMANQLIASVVTYIITFIFFIIIFNIIAKYIAKLVRNDENSVLDRFFGGVIGFVKGYTFCLFIYFLIYSFNSVLNPDFNDDNKIENVEEVTPDWLKNSKSYPIFYTSIVKLDYLMQKMSKKTNDEASNINKETQALHSKSEKYEGEINNQKNENTTNKTTNTENNSNLDNKTTLDKDTPAN